MADSGENRALRSGWIAAAAWSTVVAVSLAWNVFHERAQMMETARAEAISAFNKDLVFRLWATQHGGVYVPITPTQPPVPWMAHIADRDLTATNGKRLTLLNPATMLRQIMDRYSLEYGVKGRITGLRYINPANAPDAWEKAQMQAFLRGERQEAWAVSDIDAQPYMRYIRAMYMEPGCVKCHGYLGFKVGDLRGGIGVNVPLDPYQRRFEAAWLNLGGTHGAIWLLGLAGIAVVGRRARRDALARQRLTQALGASRERFELAAAGANDGLWDMDLLAGTMVHSPRMAEMLGYTPIELPANLEAWRMQLHPDDVEPLMQAFQTHVSGESERFQFEFRARAKDGGWRWIRTRGRAVRDASGRAVRVVGVHTDVTDFKSLQARLHLEKERALVTLGSIGEAVLSTDAEGNITFMNAVAERLTGWRFAEAEGVPAETVAALYEESTRTPLESPIQRACRTAEAGHAGEQVMLIDRNGREVAVDESAAPIRDREGHPIGAVMVLRDVTRSRELTRQMSWQLTHDALTGLASRSEFERQLQRFVEQARANDSVHALLYLDLDQFKIVNDTSGHLAGDELLKQLAFMLADQMRRSDVLARLGGDEFAALLENCPLPKALEIAEKMRATVGEFRFSWQGKMFNVGASIGVAMIGAATAGVEAALAEADMACYAAKEAGRNRIHVYRPADAESGGSLGEMQLVTAVQAALARDGFVLFAHEILPLRESSAPRCFEVLARMTDVNGGLLMPGVWISAAERYGLMPEVDRWVLRHAFEQLARAQGEMRQATLFINLSGLSLRGEAGMQEYILNQARSFAIDPGQICFEITETAAVAHLSTGVQFIRELKQQGFRFALDDFGAGMSSFVYLKALPVDYLKIDGAFVRDMAHDPVDRVFVETIHRIGRLMGKQTIAEYVENDELLALARTMGLDYAQGDAAGEHRPLDALLAGY